MTSEYWGGHVLIDPKDMEQMFTYEDAFASLPTVWDELQPESMANLDRVRGLLDKIPPREADFLELYYFKKVRQTGIASLFNVSQPTVCYRLVRGAQRLKYLLDLPEYTVKDMEKDLAGVLSDKMDIRIMLGMAETTCQSEVARSLGVTQGFVRYRFFRTLAQFKRMRGMETYIEIFTKVSENLNVLQDTCRFSWNDPIVYSVS